MGQGQVTKAVGKHHPGKRIEISKLWEGGGEKEKSVVVPRKTRYKQPQSQTVAREEGAGVDSKLVGKE